MKVFISDNGITHSTDVYFEDSDKAFAEAITASSSLSCPSSFKYYNYIKSINSNLRKQRNKLSSLQKSLINAQKSYDLFNDGYIQKAKRLTDVDIPEKLPATRLESIIDN